MRALTVLALVAIALGAIMHFWPAGDQQPVAPPAANDASQRDAAVTPSVSLEPVQRAPVIMSAPSPGPAVRPGSLDRPPDQATRVALRAPATVRRDDTFSVMIDLQALRGVRHLEFSVSYKKSILQMLGSSPGEFAARSNALVQFEESSDGHLFVRVDVESGVIAGSGSIAVVEFQALKPGVSPLLVHDMTYLEVGSQDNAMVSVVYEGSLTVD